MSSKEESLGRLLLLWKPPAAARANVMAKNRTTVCDGCNEMVEVDADNKFVTHPAQEVDKLAGLRNCPSSGLVDLDAPPMSVGHEFNGGLPTLGIHHR